VANAAGNNGKSLAEALNDIKVDLKEFLSTRLQMLQVEMKEKIDAAKISVPALLIGAMVLLIAFFLFTGGLVALIALAMVPAPYAYVVAFFAVGVLYGLGGGAVTAYGIKTLRTARLKPERTLRVLKQDQAWLQTEARTQI
jgi:uncharacterized membrane protein YqjE